MKRIKLFPVLAVLGIALILVGALLLLAIIRSQETNAIVTPPSSVDHMQSATQQTQNVGGEPVALNIPSLKMALQVIPGVYNPRTKTWTLTLDKVQYATMTPEPNTQGGNTFMYGHYRPEVFAYLHHISTDAQAIVTTANGHLFYYQLSSIRVVSPEDSASVFSYQGPPILTLQTCTGLFFQSRQLFTFNLVKVV